MIPQSKVIVLCSVCTHTDSGELQLLLHKNVFTLQKLESWLSFVDPAFEVGIQYVEDHPSIPVSYEDNPSGAASREHSRKLYSILAGILKERPFKILRQVGDANGLEVLFEAPGCHLAVAMLCVTLLYVADANNTVQESIWVA